MLDAQTPVDAVARTEALGGPSETAPTSIAHRKRVGVTFWLAAAWLFIVVSCALLASVLPIQSPTDVDPLNRLLPVGTPHHVFGTDEIGRDILSRLIFGARVSLIVAGASVVIGAGIGVPVGMLAGYFARRVDSGLMFVIDVVLSFPALVLLTVLVTFVGHSLVTVSLALGFLAIPVYARISRAVTLATTSREFVLAARAAGSRNSRILLHEILPNLVPSLLGYALIACGHVIVIEGTLSFLGLSVQAPVPSWGGLIASGSAHLSDAPSMVLVASGVMFVTVLVLNYLGDRVRQAYDVREARI